MRLQKYLSACGFCSRRQAEQYIADGCVTVNGRVALLGESVDEGSDTVCVNGRELSLPEKHTYVMVHKPKGYVTTLSDPQGRPTVAELVTDAGIRLFPVGRLDYASEGLLLMTDDGETANRLAHPSHQVPKTYRVWVKGEAPADSAKLLGGPLTYRDVTYQPAEVEIVKLSEKRATLDITVREGKNHEVRNMCAAVGLRVERLVRLRLGELSLGSLPAGQWRYLSSREAAYLRDLK